MCPPPMRPPPGRPICPTPGRPPGNPIPGGPPPEHPARAAEPISTVGWPWTATGRLRRRWRGPGAPELMTSAVTEHSR
jgi:hypothetical protein